LPSTGEAKKTAPEGLCFNSPGFLSRAADDTNKFAALKGLRINPGFT